MGLDISTTARGGNFIREYERFGSYSTIHILRKWVYIHLEGFTEKQVDAMYNHSEPGEQLEAVKFPALCEHADSDGGYLDGRLFDVTFNKPVMWNDLNKLQEEVNLLNTYREEMPEEVQDVLDRMVKFLSPDEDGYKPAVMWFL